MSVFANSLKWSCWSIVRLPVCQISFIFF